MAIKKGLQLPECLHVLYTEVDGELVIQQQPIGEDVARLRLYIDRGVEVNILASAARVVRTRLWDYLTVYQQWQDAQPEQEEVLEDVEDTYKEKLAHWKTTEPKEPTATVETLLLSVGYYKQLRDEGRYAPVEVDGLMFDCDPESLKNVDNVLVNWDAIMADTYLRKVGMTTDEGMYWTLVDNSSALVTKALLVKVGAAATIRGSVLHMEYLRRKAAVT